MNERAPIVFVVDDDPSVRSAIKRLIGSMGLQVELFGSAQEPHGCLGLHLDLSPREATIERDGMAA